MRPPRSAAPGVLTVVTGEDIKDLVGPIPVSMTGQPGPEFHASATDTVRFVGDPVAVVVAESRHEAEDAAELIDVSLRRATRRHDYDAALDPANLVLFADRDDNVLATDSSSVGDVDAVFADADRVIELTLRQQRVCPVPMETRGAVADYDPASGDAHLLMQLADTRTRSRMALANTLELPIDSVRVLVPDVGGAFGLKSSFGARRLLRCRGGAAAGPPGEVDRGPPREPHGVGSRS